MSEMNGTKQSNKTLEAPRKVPCLRLAGAALAIGGLSTSLAVIGAGAATSSDVSTSQNAKYGTILVSGKTVYTLKASKVPCRVQCLKFWPEVLLPKGVTTTTAGPGVNAASLGSVRGNGGSRQVTYRGKRLYYFFKDTAPGQVNGNNLTTPWGKWSVVVTAKPAHPSSGSGGTQTTSAGSGGVSF
jgi:predicted lipoprotein with Yx(FWY)xxD motif